MNPKRSRAVRVTVLLLALVLVAAGGIYFTIYGLPVDPGPQGPALGGDSTPEFEPSQEVEEMTVLLNQRLSVVLGVPARAPLGRINPFAYVTSRVPDLPPVEPEPEPDPIPEQPSEPPEYDPADGLQLTLTTLDRCWLEVWVDGRQVLRTNVNRGTTLTWTAESEINLEQVGREWALGIILNGEDLGLAEDVAEGLTAEPRLITTEGGQVEVSLERRYESHVLVGFRFRIP